MYKVFLKRFIDIIVSGVALLILLPVMIVISIILFFINGGSIFFTQKRLGLKLKEIKIVKFKSMNDKRDETGEYLPDDVRLTKTGRFIRKTSLDELPQLWNVFKGDMSLIGPRPLPVVYYEYYSNEELKRHNVRPGISGLAQVNGRNFSSWEQRFAFDLEYIEKLSFILDVKIILQTIKKVITNSDYGVRGIDFEDNSLDEIRPKRTENE